MATRWNTTKTIKRLARKYEHKPTFWGWLFLYLVVVLNPQIPHSHDSLVRNGDEMKWIIAVFTFIAQNWTAISALIAAMVPAKEAVTAHMQLAAARASVLSGGVAGNLASIDQQWWNYVGGNGALSAVALLIGAAAHSRVQEAFAALDRESRVAERDQAVRELEKAAQSLPVASAARIMKALTHEA